MKVYIFTNISMPGFVKIGFTDRDSSICVAEQHSGIPFPHTLQFEIFLDVLDVIERKIHFEPALYNESKEFFRITPQLGTSKISEIVGDSFTFFKKHFYSFINNVWVLFRALFND